MKKEKIIGLFFLGFLMSGCSDNGLLFRSVGSYQSNTDNKGVYLIEKPYEINGVTYTPAEDYNYFDSGDAFWYDFDSSHPLTKNGERVDGTRYTAMHRTLPLPSIVRVTNLRNKASVLVRVNERGPFDNNRLIDVSKPVAEYLNFSKTEVTPVQVEVMVAESKALKEQLQKTQAVYTKTFATQTPQSSKKGEVIIDADSILYPGMNNENIQALKVSSAPQNTSLKKQTKKDNDIIYSGADYYVQIGAFSQQESVNKITQKLSNYNNLIILNRMKNNQLLHYVRVGPFITKSEAQKALDKVHKTGYLEARIIHE